LGYSNQGGSYGTQGPNKNKALKKDGAQNLRGNDQNSKNKNQMQNPRQSNRHPTLPLLDDTGMPPLKMKQPQLTPSQHTIQSQQSSNIKKVVGARP
jgi:hypothetical protein